MLAHFVACTCACALVLTLISPTKQDPQSHLDIVMEMVDLSVWLSKLLLIERAGLHLLSIKLACMAQANELATARPLHLLSNKLVSASPFWLAWASCHEFLMYPIIP